MPIRMTPTPVRVEKIPDKFERGHRQTLGLVEDQHFNKRLVRCHDQATFHVPMKMIVNARGHPSYMPIESFPQVTQSAKYSRRMENGARTRQMRSHGDYSTPR